MSFFLPSSCLILPPSSLLSPFFSSHSFHVSPHLSIFSFISLSLIFLQLPLLCFLPHAMSSPYPLPPIPQPPLQVYQSRSDGQRGAFKTLSPLFHLFRFLLSYSSYFSFTFFSTRLLFHSICLSIFVSVLVLVF